MKKVFLLSIVLPSLLLNSCTSTKIVSSWSEPDKEVTIANLSKVLVVAMFPGGSKQSQGRRPNGGLS